MNRRPAAHPVAERTAIEKAKQVCGHCNGSGKVRYYHGDFDTCPTCHGAGVLIETDGTA